MTHDAIAPTPAGMSAASPAAASGWLQKTTDALCGVAAGATLLVVLAQVASRLFATPLTWSEELTRACFIWMIFMGLASSMRHADAARVTVFMQILPRPLRALSLPIYLVCSIGFFVVMAWTGAAMVRQQIVMNESIATLGCPGWVIGIVVPASAVIAILATLASLRDHKAAIAIEEPAS